MNNDLSDEAFAEWYQPAADGDYPTADAAWQEARRRAEEGLKAMLIREMEARAQEAFEAGFLMRNLKNWNSQEAWQAYKEQHGG